MSARETQRARLREPRASCSAADAASRLTNGLRRLAAVPDSMLELQAVSGPRADSHAVTGVVSTFDPKQTALEPPNLRAWSTTLACATCRCGCAAAVVINGSCGRRSRASFCHSARAPCRACRASDAWPVRSPTQGRVRTCVSVSETLYLVSATLRSLLGPHHAHFHAVIPFS